MAAAHPLDRPVWQALSGRQRHLSLGDDRALRFQPDYALFAAAADDSPGNLAALTALMPEGGRLWVVEGEPGPIPPGTAVASRALCDQMVAESLTPATRAEVAFIDLVEADAPDMLALALLTEPGPFLARTHQLGDFVGVKSGGALAAMAGERMRPPGHTEVSGVCTHPDHRGRGYAAMLTRVVAQRILDRGEVPYLHVYSTNTPAIAVYEALGFRFRRTVTATVLERA